MYFLSDAYRLRAAIIAERTEERAAKAAAEPVEMKKSYTPAAPVPPPVERRPVFSFGGLLRLPTLR